MAMQITANPYQRPDDRLYAVPVRGQTIYLYWSEMNLAQRRVQVTFEADISAMRAAYEVNFDPNGLNAL